MSSDMGTGDGHGHVELALAPEKRPYLGGFHRVNRGARELLS